MYKFKELYYMQYVCFKDYVYKVERRDGMLMFYIMYKFKELYYM